MTLEQLVTDLATSQRLRDAGFPQDTAMVWVVPIGIMGLAIPYVALSSDSINHHFKCVAAPTAGELMDAIRVKADAMEEKADRGMELGRHEYDGKIIWEVVGQGKGMCEDDWLAAEGKGITDLEALAALVLEVAG